MLVLLFSNYISIINIKTPYQNICLQDFLVEMDQKDFGEMIVATAIQVKYYYYLFNYY